MSHHKKPVKPSLPKSQLFLSSGLLIDDLLPSIGNDASGRPPTLPSRPILYHPFTSQLNLLLTDEQRPSNDQATRAPVAKQDLSDHLSSLGTYQSFSGLNLSQLMDFNFIQTYIRSGSLVALSVSKLIGDDVVAIDGHGTMHMRVCQFTYQHLGLPGRRSKFGPRGQHFVVEIDLRDQAMKPGNSIYHRTKKCLENFPSNIFGQFTLSHDHQGRSWDIAMTWVDEKGSLKLVEIAGTPPTNVKTCIPEINVSEKEIRDIPRPAIDSPVVEDLLNLYEFVGEAILPTDGTSGKQCVSACSIEARSLFHPFKLAELAQRLIKTYKVIGITAHTSRSSPFSFLISRQARPRPIPTPPLNKKKKIKKGKSVMRGPERGMDAGPTSWTLIVLNDDRSVSQPSLEPAGPVDRATVKRMSSTPDPALKRAKVDEDKWTTHLQRPWLMFESVGHDDTHC